MRPVLSDIQNIIVTSSIAFVTGYVFQIFGLPAPFLLGSLFGVWIIAGIIPPIRSRVGIPRWVFVPVILGLGTLIGANFRPDILPISDRQALPLPPCSWPRFWQRLLVFSI
jgi:uncharacterized membrane protein AbrB (regulator of aidB expression)